MASISREAAQELFNILDEGVGFFWVEDMTEKAEAFRQRQCDKFFNAMTTDIPSVFWFQGKNAASVELHFDSTGFRLYGDPETLHHWETVVIDEVNEKIHDLKIDVLD